MITYLKSIVYTIITIIIGSIITTILNYFNIINGITLKIIMLLIPLIGISIGSFLIGKTSTQKGYIEGLKYGLLWIIILLIINLIIKNFTIISIIYYSILLLISILTSILGINTKKD
jgi:putative membrane protein (TIGR04086 family)